MAVIELGDQDQQAMLRVVHAARQAGEIRRQDPIGERFDIVWFSAHGTLRR